MLASHYHIATCGVRQGHKSIASLGLGFILEIIVTPIPSTSGGGGGGGYRPERRTPYNPLYSLININFNNKEEIFWFYTVKRMYDVDVEVKLLREDTREEVRLNDAIIEVLLNKIIESSSITLISVKEIK